MMKLRTSIYAVLAAAAILVVLMGGYAIAAAPHPDHIRSFSLAVERGLIAGDPAYYYNGTATNLEYAHAIITATLEIDNRVADLEESPTGWVPPPPSATEADPASYCADRLWEYRTEPGTGYQPQTFADSTDRYDSLTLFDDFYGPVTYLMPSAGRVYEHPAGGYDRLIVCWTANY